MDAWLSGDREPRPHLSCMTAPAKDRVQISDLPFYSFCGHHFVPFFGTVSIEYIPNAFIAGLGGFARVIDYYARRPQFQETLTAQIADHIFEDLTPTGVSVQISARQMCMELKGYGSGVVIRTQASRGQI